MKVKKVKIGFQSMEASLEEAKKTIRLIEQGNEVKKEVGVYFTSFEAFRKALTPKRLELLHIIKARTPKSIKELAEMGHGGRWCAKFREGEGIEDQPNKSEKVVALRL